MNAPDDEARIIAALAPARERCAQDVLEFMSACGVRFTTVPPLLLQLLTTYALTAVDVGQALARATGPNRSAEPVAPLPNGVTSCDDSGVRWTTDGTRRLRTDPNDVTRKVALLPRSSLA